MGTWDRILAMLRREKRDLGEIVDDLSARANENLGRKERELAATPEEKLAMEEERGREIDAELDAIRRRVEGGSPDS